MTTKRHAIATVLAAAVAALAIGAPLASAASSDHVAGGTPPAPSIADLDW